MFTQGRSFCAHAKQTKTVVEALALRALALAADIDMTSRIVIFEDERIRIRPPLALVPPQDQP
jgi:hypothetical protein